MHCITKEEIIDTLSPVNNGYFHIPNLNEYAEKVTKLGKALVKRDDTAELLSYILYYDNGPDIFITMVWTKPEQQGSGLAKSLVQQLINSSNKEILLEVNPQNAARYLYRNLKFTEEDTNGEKFFMRYHRRISVMQPYIFPYLGYFHLIEASEKIIFYDDVNYIKRGWMNRNRILLNNTNYLFTIPVENASQNKLINEIAPLANEKFIKKFFAQIETAYKKAPYYKEVLELLSYVMQSTYNNIADLNINSIVAVYNYLNKEIKWEKSSVCSSASKGMDKADRLITITKELNYKKYVNAIGGQELYNKEYFKNQDIQLNFVQSNNIEYRQFNNDFIPWLSVIDTLMFNDKKTIKEQLSQYSLI